MERYRKELIASGFPFDAGIPEPKPPYTYIVPENRMFVVPTLCVPGCNKGPHNEDCQKIVNDSVLEDYFLQDKLNVANAMAAFVGISNLETEPFVLDIDLDYIHTRKAACPDSSSVFQRLVRNAAAVTIAMEAECVSDLAMAGENLSSEFLFEKVIEQIQSA